MWIFTVHHTFHYSRSRRVISVLFFFATPTLFLTISTPDLNHHYQDGTQSTILLSSSFVPNFRPAIGTVTAAFVSPPLQSTLQQQRQHHPTQPSTTIDSHQIQRQNQRRTVQMLQGQPQRIQQSVSSTSGSDMVLSSEHPEPSHEPPSQPQDRKSVV